MSPEHLKDERYEELCALGAVGELSAAEFAELNEHLATCDNCQALYFDFRRIAANEMGAVAAGRRLNDAAAELDQPALLHGVLTRAQSEIRREIKPDEIQLRSHGAGHSWTAAFSNLLRGPILAAAALLVLCAAVGIGGYQLRDRQLSPRVNQFNSQPGVREGDAEAFAAQSRSASVALQPIQAERDALQKSLTEARRGYAELLHQRQVLQAELAAAKELAAQKDHDLQLAGNAAQRSEGSAKLIEARLQDALLRAQEQAGLVDQLKARLQRSEQQVATASGARAPDGDAKEIFGARDLHMVDVYDVDASGKTKRSFGRVYFVEKKLLLFYAFDLQDKQRQRVAAAFQAWGYRQGNEGKPQNLGLFLMDDPAISRWVLKVNDTRVLDHVDAVFVTLEPPSGSPAPSGRRLLYANLGGPPNHP